MADIEWNVTTAEACDKSGILVPKIVWVDRSDNVWVEQGNMIPVRAHAVDKQAIILKIVETIRLGQRQKHQFVMASYLRQCAHHDAVERVACRVPGLDKAKLVDLEQPITEYVGQDGIGAVSVAGQSGGYYPVAFPPRSNSELALHPARALMPIRYGKHTDPAGYLAVSAVTQSIDLAK